mgnify:CR=1 FL=1
MFGFKTALTLAYKRYSWRRHNANNGTTLGRYLVGTDNISIGRGSYGPISILTSDQNPKVVIGSFCSIADGVTFVTGNEHPIDRFSTYPFKVMLLGDKEGEALTKGGIVVEDDVWIGYGATILDGVRIHRGGRRCRSRRLERRAALHNRWWSACETASHPIRFGDDREAPLIWLLNDGYTVRQDPSRFALCAPRLQRSRGVAK